MAGSGNEKPPLGYIHGEFDTWEGGINFTAEHSDDGTQFVQLTGNCPRCRHEISKDIRPLKSGAFFAATGAGSSFDPKKPPIYLVTCNCVFAHQDAPQGTRGCGAQFALEVTPRGGTHPDIEHVKGAAADWDKDEWIGRAEHEQLPRLRELAAQWTTMLGVVTGFLAVGTIFDFTRKDLGLSSGAWAAYILFAGLLALAVAAVYRGSQAAGLRYLGNVPADVGGRVQHVDEAVVFCSEKLARSRSFALASVLALALALVVRVVA